MVLEIRTWAFILVPDGTSLLLGPCSSQSKGLFGSSLHTAAWIISEAPRWFFPALSVLERTPVPQSMWRTVICTNLPLSPYFLKLVKIIWNLFGFRHLTYFSYSFLTLTLTVIFIPISLPISFITPFTNIFLYLQVFLTCFSVCLWKSPSSK